MVLSLIGPLDNNRVQRILLVAAYAGTKLKVVPITVGVENESEEYRRNCHPLGRVPTLKSDEGYLFETNAIIRYIARTERPYGADGNERYPSPQCMVPYILYGKSVQEAAEVDAWLDFVLTELDPYIFPLVEAEAKAKGAVPRLDEAALARLQEGLHGLEQRLVFKKQLLKLLAGGGGIGGSSNTALSARTGTNDDVEDGLSEEDCFSATPRESTVLRGYHTYNIKTCIEVPSERSSSSTAAYGGGANGSNTNEANGGVSRPSLHASAMSPRLSTLTPRRSANPSSDMLFLVGDSLTAADLVVAFAVNYVLSAKRLNVVVKQHYPQLVRHHSSILRLPVATSVRKALGVSLI
ncbi:putative elongation factor 1-gamma (EF-1-gamma) [Trypanosoma grayi]|uniref:putative elongation factor 1-gamma (EF-1-gamma) n=1 Tax=Trypanosoma grayi TaxID=71804 RepID=UPI0004F470C1|nr:putative elongation factor 1-gamma (EF-1-gamma) [Trypanosoma grayi]KEG06319.1 putative elongation factor 1-gamma (EF-1-gamma) [Trypanosoma grayi]